MRHKISFVLACLALLAAMFVAGCVPGESPTPTIPADTPEPEAPSWLRIYTDVSFSGPSLGLICGWQGTIMRSTDGGQTWSRAQVPTEGDLNSIAILDANTAIAVGSSGNILRSIDGGLTWKQVASPTGETLNSVAAIRGGQAVAVGWHGINIVTSDSGETWTASDISGNAHSLYLEAVDFTEDGTGMTVSSSGYVFKTTNGTGWQQLALPEPGLKLYSVDLYDPDTAIVAGNVDEERSYTYGGKTVSLKTSNGGQNWEFGPSNWNADLLAIRFIDSKNAIATGWDGVVFRTEDGGQNWAPMVSHTNQALRGIALVDDNNIFAVGDGQTIIRSRDGGYNWEKVGSL